MNEKDKIEKISVELCGNIFQVTVKSGPEWFTKCWRAWESGAAEKSLFDFIENNAAPNAIFFDIGAFVGVASLASAPHYAKVYAFEADSVALADLRANIEANSLKNIEAIGKFVGYTDKKMTMYSEGNRNSSGSSAFHEGGKHSWEVEMIKIDNFIEENTSKDETIVLKIDIEGAEYLCVHLLRRFVKSGKILAVCLSLHPLLLAKSVKGTSTIAKIRRRMTVLRGTMRVYSFIRCFRTVKDAEGNEITPLRLFSDILLRGCHRGSESEIYISNSVR